MHLGAPGRRQTSGQAPVTRYVRRTPRTSPQPPLHERRASRRSHMISSWPSFWSSVLRVGHRRPHPPAYRRTGNSPGTRPYRRRRPGRRPHRGKLPGHPAVPAAPGSQHHWPTDSPPVRRTCHTCCARQVCTTRVTRHPSQDHRGQRVQGECDPGAALSVAVEPGALKAAGTRAYRWVSSAQKPGEKAISTSPNPAAATARSSSTNSAIGTGGSRPSPHGSWP